MTGPGESGRPAIDPRHDAIYQRGYQPGETSRPPVHRPLIGAPPAAPGVAAEINEVPAFDTDVFQDELPRSAWNPFIAILWVVAVLFIGASTTLQWQAVTASYAGFSYSGTGPLPLDMVIQQLSYQISPSLQISGLLTVAGLLFWHAASWRARRLARLSGD